MGDWRARIVEALAAGGCASQTEWVDKHPGVHCWFRFRDDTFDSCACCGTVRRRDDRNKPCRGVVTIELRG
jgi:hypothetical protein